MWATLPAVAGPRAADQPTHDGRGEQDGGSRIGLHYRHTTPEMAARAVAAIEERLGVVLQVAEQMLETHPNRTAPNVF